MQNREYMRRAVSLAKLGTGRVNPNPLVGAVIVKDGRIIGEGYHAGYGMLHAERSALSNCTEPAEGAWMYVTLEPCCHHGKQPPCTTALIESGIRRVYTGSADPNPLVAGRGIQMLREHGIEVVEGFLREECDALNPVFFHYIKNRTPYVALKYAMTMDGRTACYTGASKWITGEDARMKVQKLRNAYTGIMAGIRTVISDDPLLTCRIPGGRSPVRIICDTDLSIPADSRLVQTARDERLIIATAAESGEKRRMLEAAGCECLTVPKAETGIDLNALMQSLGGLGIDSILLEGGGTLGWSALKCGIVKKVYCFIAPKIFGGANAPSPVAGQGVRSPAEAFGFHVTDIRRIGGDILIESEAGQGCLQES